LRCTCVQGTCVPEGKKSREADVQDIGPAGNVQRSPSGVGGLSDKWPTPWVSSKSTVGTGRRTVLAISGRTNRFPSSPKRPPSLLFIGHRLLFFWGVKQPGKLINKIKQTPKLGTYPPPPPLHPHTHTTVLMLGPYINDSIDLRNGSKLISFQTTRNGVIARSKFRLPESDDVRATNQVTRDPATCLVEQSVV
jgi:hypothetical protein